MSEGTPMALVPAGYPLMKAWTSYQETEDFKNTFKWTITSIVLTQASIAPELNRVNPIEERERRAMGALWAAFMAGFNAATERAAYLHESVNPASDEERQHNVPGAGAMGAVIQYRDLIRATAI